MSPPTTLGRCFLKPDMQLGVLKQASSCFLSALQVITLISPHLSLDVGPKTGHRSQDQMKVILCQFLLKKKRGWQNTIY